MSPDINGFIKENEIQVGSSERSQLLVADPFVYRHDHDRGLDNQRGHNNYILHIHMGRCRSCLSDTWAASQHVNGRTPLALMQLGRNTRSLIKCSYALYGLSHTDACSRASVQTRVRIGGLSHPLAPVAVRHQANYSTDEQHVPRSSVTKLV